MTPEEFWAALANMPEPQPIFHRLYYNENGDPMCYTMEDLPGNYIDIDADTYCLQPRDVKVISGKLVYINQGIKLRPRDSGVPCDPRDVCVVVPESKQHINWNY